MTYVRELAADLVDKKLWPVAALLGGALVVVPLLPGPDAPPAPSQVAAATVTTTASPEAAAVAAEVEPVATTTPTRTSDRPGELHDPFAAQPGAAAAALATGDLPTLAKTPQGASDGATGASAATRAADAANSAGGGGGAATTTAKAASTPAAASPTTSTAAAATTPTTATAPSTTATTTTPVDGVSTSATPVAPGRSSVRIVLKVRAVGSDASTTLRDPARLAVLPSPQVPAAVMLGALDDGGVVFMLDRNSTSWGEGTCPLPHSGCPALVLRPGQTQLLDLPAAGGVVRRSALTVVSVKRVTVPAAAQAARERQRRSTPGLELVRDGIEAGNSALAAYSYDAERGVVVPDPARMAATGTAPATTSP